jgi:hypothetical protein
MQDCAKNGAEVLRRAPVMVLWCLCCKKICETGYLIQNRSWFGSKDWEIQEHGIGTWWGSSCCVLKGEAITSEKEQPCQPGSSPSSSKAITDLIGSLPSYPPPILTTTRRPHLQIVLAWEFGDPVSNSWTFGNTFNYSGGRIRYHQIINSAIKETIWQRMSKGKCVYSKELSLLGKVNRYAENCSQWQKDFGKFILKD